MEAKFLEIKVKDMMREEDLPLAERGDSIEEVLPFPMGRSHVWVLDDLESRRVIGVITEHDILDMISPKRVPYNFGLPDMRRLEAGHVGDIMT